MTDVLQAAAQALKERGYADGTTNRIAVRAGVSISPPYQYFPNMEAVAVALFERHVQEGMRCINDWVATSIREPRSLHDTLALFVKGIIVLQGALPRGGRPPHGLG